MKNDNNTKTVSKKDAAKAKATAINILKGLHAKLIKQATEAIQRNPEKTGIITKAMDADLARINYTMNLVTVKM